ncbi:MAG TPA: hypothetical protein VHV28_16270 [Solirubrobacteraceae bacterium]|jgi:hypothetical protein|nr:hypothetical protein [Solirubrobacteraceae bacterium]
MAGSSGPGPSTAQSLVDGRLPDPLELYKAVRAHELMLNGAASAFEQAVITRLAALNGGAASVFLTLLGVLLKTNGSQKVDTPFAVAAIVAWSAGLLAASYAAWHGLRVQRSINRAHRLMRQGLEHYLWPELAPFVKPPERTQPQPADVTTREQNDSRQDLIDGLGPRRKLHQQWAAVGRWFDWMAPTSAGCFTLGTVFALVAIVA